MNISKNKETDDELNRMLNHASGLIQASTVLQKELKLVHEAQEKNNMTSKNNKATEVNNFNGHLMASYHTSSSILISLAVEILLKALSFITTKKRLKGTHDLSKIVNQLLPEDRKELKRKYLLKSNGGFYKTIRMMSSKTKAYKELSHLEEKQTPTRGEFEDLIKSSRKSFEAWRYLYEKGRKDISIGSMVHFDTQSIIHLYNSLLELINEKKK